MKIRVCGFTKESVVDGPGIRAVVFAQGCPHRCVGCHNPDTWDSEDGFDLEIDDILFQIASNPLLRGLTLTGGEPFAQSEGFAELAARVKSSGLDVVTYSGYTYEELMEKGRQDVSVMKILENTDILIDGPYMEELKDLSLAYRGSRNQRIIDINSSFQTGKVVQLEY
ncbi:MAG: anaerobic ribonucleoside-triphosphate reductase activating protein [Ignavibacteriales bacterium]